MAQIFYVLIMNNKTLPVTSKCNLSNIQKTKRQQRNSFLAVCCELTFFSGNYKDFKCWSVILAQFYICVLFPASYFPALNLNEN